MHKSNPNKEMPKTLLEVLATPNLKMVRVTLIYRKHLGLRQLLPLRTLNLITRTIKNNCNFIMNNRSNWTLSLNSSRVNKMIILLNQLFHW